MTVLTLTDQAVLTRLKRQLRADYPEDALDWLDELEWTPPEDVPLDKIDYDDNIFQRVRDREDDKVASFAKRIKAGWRKPVILVDRPTMKMKAVDGHTRLEAYKTISTPARAWVGKAKTNKGPWDYFHRKQLQTVNGQACDLLEFPITVRTPAGERFYRQPIGSIVYADSAGSRWTDRNVRQGEILEAHSHQDLLDIRRDVMQKYERDTDIVRKVRAAVVASRKAGRGSGAEPTAKPKPTSPGDGVDLRQGGGGSYLAYRTGGTSPIGIIHKGRDGRFIWDHADTGVQGRGTYISPEAAARALLVYDKGAKGEASDIRGAHGSVAFWKALSRPQQDRYRQEIVGMQERQAKLIPSIVKAANIHVTPLPRNTNADYSPNVAPSVRGGRDDAKIRIKPSRFGLGKHRTGDGWHARGDGETSAQHTLAHEYGHGVHYALAYHNNVHGVGGGSTIIPTDPKLWTDIASELGVHPPLINGHGDLTYGIIEAWVTKNKRVLEYAVSRYGATGVKELLADMWAEYSTTITDPNGSQPGPVAKIYGEYARRRL